MFNPGMVERPILTAQERRPYHRAELQSFERTRRAWVTGVNSVMVPAGMEPRLAEVYAGFNVWVDPYQGFYWVDGFEPTFATPQEARAFVLTQVPSITEPNVVKSVIPFVLLLGVLSQVI